MTDTLKKSAGGKREGSGRPKGSINRSTPVKLLKKEQAREMVRAHITKELIPLLKAQLENAKGVRHFFLRDRLGKWQRITDPQEIERALNAGEGYWISTKDPNVQAFTELLNRALDKPAEQMKVTGKDDGPVELVVKWATPKG